MEDTTVLIVAATIVIIAAAFVITPTIGIIARTIGVIGTGLFDNVIGVTLITGIQYAHGRLRLRGSKNGPMDCQGHGLGGLVVWHLAAISRHRSVSRKVRDFVRVD
jgi:hypothetical protein